MRDRIAANTPDSESGNLGANPSPAANLTNLFPLENNMEPITLQTWAVYVGGTKRSEDFTSKRRAQAECRRLNGSKSGGRRQFHVQRSIVKDVTASRNR